MIRVVDTLAMTILNIPVTPGSTLIKDITCGEKAAKKKEIQTKTHKQAYN